MMLPPDIRTKMSALDFWKDPSGVAALLDDWREKLAVNPHKTTDTDSIPPQTRVQEFVRGGGPKCERLFFYFLHFNFSKGGPSSENSRENDISD